MSMQRIDVYRCSRPQHQSFRHLRFRNPSNAVLAGLCLYLSGCAAPNIDLTSLPGPAPSVTPAPTPTTTASATIGPAAAPTLGSNALPPVVAKADVDFESPPVSQTSEFRLTQSSRTISVGAATTTASDAATDAGGATLAIDWPADTDTTEPTLRFSLGNSGLGVNNVKLTPNSTNSAYEATLSNGRVLTVFVSTTDLSSAGAGDSFSWTAYGNWGIRSATNMAQNGSYVVGGFETPDSAIPLSGTATFNGFVDGTLAAPDGTSIASAILKGDATLTANFATGAISGTADSISAIKPGGTAQAWNSLVFSGNFTSGINGFTGTAGVSSAPGNSLSMLGSATGFLTGRFFGPGAEELGALWNLYDGTKLASGTLVAERNR